MITLYVREPGTLVRRTGNRLVVEKDGATLRSVRLREVERVALCGNVTLTAPAAQALLEGGIETALLSRGGRFLGRLSPGGGKNVFLRRVQFQRCEDAQFRLTVARSIVRGKLRNARELVMRHHRNHPQRELAATAEGLTRRSARLAEAATLDTIRGIEGEAARRYFAALGTMVRSGFEFSGRSRRPPRDPVNALLSFAYTLLTTELAGAAAAQGLDPDMGFLHDLDYGRPSLALDLVEEFRQPAGDRLVLSLINRSVIRPEHFDSTAIAAERDESGTERIAPEGAARGVLLNDAGRRIFLEFYHRALETAFEDRASGRRLNYRELFEQQSGKMRETILGGHDYAPYAAR